MPAPGITYSGVLKDKGADVDEDEEPCVFQGFKFWLSVRVPHRQTYSDTIEENGGTIVAKEKSADILICDPAKDPAPGSYSYQLIENAIKEGSLERKGDYLCSLPAFQVDGSRLTPKAKITRSKFTKEDDRLLIKYVTQKERLGEPISGKQIYQEFEKQYPHHPWQSWRDRWVKKLKSLPRPQVLDGEQSTQAKAPSRPSSQGVNTDTANANKPRLRFTAEEDELLLETIHHAIENREPWNGYEPYKRLASEFPQRTYASWRERALNHIAKQNKGQILQWEREADFHPGNGEDATTDNTKNQQIRGEEGQSNALTSNIVPDQRNESMRTGGVKGRIENYAGQESMNENDNKREHQGTASSSVHRTGLQRLPSQQRIVERNASNYPALSIANTSPIPDRGASTTTKEQFYRDYNTFLESLGIADRQIPSIGGKAIALWDLWQSVRSKVDTAGLDWQQIAEDLGFDWVSMESVPKELQQFYEEHLEPFADAMMDFNDSSDGNITEEDVDRESARPLPSSPPALPSSKRSFTAMKPVYERALPQFTPKRRKIDRNHEVPSTPDHVNGTSHLRYQHNSNKSPTTPTAQPRSGALIPETRSSVRNEGEESEDLSVDLPILLRRRKRRLEPETQDFNFVSDTPIYIDDEAPGHSENGSQAAMTPSQQLLLESDAASAKTQRHVSVSAVSQRGIVQISPTAPRRTRIPFSQHSSGDDTQQKEKGSRSKRATLPAPQAQPKRRTLPASFESKAAGTTVLQTETRQRPSPIKQTPEDVIDHFISSGYTRDIVLRSLRATSWILGNASQVMEMLQRGEPLPPRTSGVWTQRDDDSLALVYSGKPPSNAAEEKKQAKEMRRLQAKHGAEQIALRKRYLLDESPNQLGRRTRRTE